MQAVLRELSIIEPMLRNLINQCQIIWDTKGEVVKTAGVGIDNNHQLTLWINPEYYKNLTFSGKISLMYHESCHIILDHIKKARSLDLDKQVLNICMDAEIDQMIPESIRFLDPIIPMTVKPLHNSKNNMDFLYYYDEYMKNYEDPGKYENSLEKGEGHSLQILPGQGQRHDVHNWEEQHGLSDKAIDHIIKAAVNNARLETERTEGKGRFNNPRLKQAIEDILKPTKVPWQRFLEDQIGSALSVNQMNTRIRPNKKLGYYAPGLKDGNSPSLVIFVDVSGSHNERLFKLSFEQIKKILEDYLDEIPVHFFADGVFEEMMLVDSNIKTVPHRIGYGGTSFNEIFVKAAEYEDVDTIIILTDGDAPCPKIGPQKFHVIWGLTDGERPGITFGTKVLISED